MTEPAIENCGKCKFWRVPFSQGDDDSRECRRHAPTPIAWGQIFVWNGILVRNVEGAQDGDYVLDPVKDLKFQWPRTDDTNGAGSSRRSPWSLTSHDRSPYPHAFRPHHEGGRPETRTRGQVRPAHR